MPDCRVLDEAAAIVAQQLVGGDVGQRHVEVAVALDVADGDAHRVHPERGPGLDRHVGERPAVRVPGRRCATGGCGRATGPTKSFARYRSSRLSPL